MAQSPKDSELVRLRDQGPRVVGNQDQGGEQGELGDQGHGQIDPPRPQCGGLAAVDHQPIGGQAHQGEAEVETHQVLAHDEPQVARHGEQEQEPEAARPGVRAHGQGRLEPGHQPQDGGKQQEDSPVPIQAEPGPQQQPGDFQARTERQGDPRHQGGQCGQRREPAPPSLPGEAGGQQRREPGQDQECRVHSPYSRRAISSAHSSGL